MFAFRLHIKIDKILFMQMVPVSTSLIQTWNILLQRAVVVVGIKRRAGVATALLCPIYLDLEIRASNEGYTKVREDFTIMEKAPIQGHCQDTMLNRHEM